MNISRFVGATNREALRQVRLALGPDALIVSNKRVNGGVEILATDQTAVPEAGASARVQAAPSTGQGRVPASVPPISGGVAPEVLGAIGDLKGTLEARIDELMWGNQLRQSSQAVGLFQTLLRFGFSTALLRAMLKRMPRQAGARAALQWARQELIAHLPVLSSEDVLWQPGLVLALVGPTGVGKTTTIAKLAARCVRRTGPDSLVLLTTDTYRIGAHEQLKIYGQMLRVPVHVVQDAQELRRVLQMVRADQTVLIDNVGISQRDRYIADQAALLAGAGRRVERVLAINASSQGDTLDEVARSYVNDGGTPLRGCIVTKIDEASCLGVALDTALRYQLPIHYVSNGQKVPENLLFLSALDLVDRALAPVEGNRALYSPSEADLAAFLSVAQPPESTEEAAGRRRQQVLLPRLLTRSAAGDCLTRQQLEEAVARLDEDVLLSEAYELWRSRALGDLPSASQSVAHLHRVAHQTLGDTASGLVIHDRRPILWEGRRGVWSGAFQFDGNGLPLAAATQQLGFPDGWYGLGEVQPQTFSAAENWLAQVGAEAGAMPGRCHVLAGATQSLMRALESGHHHWLSLCPAGTRVHETDGMGVVSAVARRLEYQPLGPQAFSGLRSAAGYVPGTVAWWAASGKVALRARGVEPLSVRLYSLRAVDAVDGRVLHTWHALGSSTEPLDHGRLACAVVLHHELRTQARAWVTLLGGDRGQEPWLDRAVYGAQLGLAAWHLVRSAALSPVARVAARMLGAEDLSSRAAQAGLLKLFALKELMAAGA